MKIDVCNWGFLEMDTIPGLVRTHTAGYELTVADEAELGRVLLSLSDTCDLMLQKKGDRHILWLDTKGGRFRCR